VQHLAKPTARTGIDLTQAQPVPAIDLTEDEERLVS
jgi:hypothetical protein